MEKEEVLRARYEMQVWLFQYGQMRFKRDQQLVAARLLGITITEIAELTGLSRQHISLITNGPGRASPPAGANSSHPEG